jgi:peptidylprolyl isomerase
MLVTAGLLVSLAACSAPTATAPDCDTTPSGPVSDSVKVTGDFGSEPKTVFDIPLTVPESTQRSVVIKGDGDTVLPGDVADVRFSIYSGANSADIAGSDWTTEDTQAFPVDDQQFLPGIVRTIECATVGSRVVGVIPPADAFGETGQADLGIGADDAIVVVIDVVGIEAPAEPAPTPTNVLPKADGADQAPLDGFPTVVLADDGRPTVTIPDTAPPTDLQLEVLKKGDGAVVADGANVTVHYEGINWNTKAIFDESWARGTPSTFLTSQVIAGFTQALVGQTVGSQVVVIVPPDLGYGPDGGRAPDIGATDTIVFVIDILAVS